MTVSERIQAKIIAALAPEFIELIDDSAAHRGHTHAPEGGESHFNLTLVAAAFEGKSRLEQQRMINEILAEELAGPVHALSMRLSAPGDIPRNGSN